MASPYESGGRIHALPRISADGPQICSISTYNGHQIHKLIPAVTPRPSISVKLKADKSLFVYYIIGLFVLKILRDVLLEKGVCGIHLAKRVQLT